MDKYTTILAELAEARSEVRSLAYARDWMKEGLKSAHQPGVCFEPECPICAIILCPFDCEEHLWKDGCPCCYGSAVEPLGEH